MIRDSPCTRLQDGAEVLLEASLLPVPDIHLYADAMGAFALEVREKTNAPWCMLPFCHTVEAETFGAKVRYGDRKNGPRVVDYACSTLDDLLTLPDMDFTQGRIAQVLAACRELHRRGETVILEITGPFTLLGGLIDPALLFRFLRKEPEKMEQVFAHLHRNLLAYMQAAQESGVSIISYADPTGGVNIIGPKLAEQMVRSFTLPLLHGMEDRLHPETLVHLCPKTAFALLDTGLAQSTALPVSAQADYAAAVLSARGKCRFIGHGCIKNHKFRSNGLNGLTLL